MAELFGLLFFALAVLLFFGLITSLIILIVTAARKKPVKNAGIMTGALGGSFIFVIVLMFVALANADDTTVTETASYPTSSSDAQSDEEEAPEAEEEIETDLATEELNESESDDSHLTKDGRDPSDPSEYNADIDVRDIQRNPDEYQDEWISFEGRIVQVMEDDVTTAYRIAVNDDIDRMVYLETLTDTLDERLLKDDNVEVYGSFYDLVTYETVMGGTRTIPAFNAHGERIALQETSE